MAPIDLLDENSIEAANKSNYESATIQVLNNSNTNLINQNETSSNKVLEPSDKLITNLDITNTNFLLIYNKNDLNNLNANTSMSNDDTHMNDKNNNLNTSSNNNNDKTSLALKEIHLKLNGSNKSLNIDTSTSTSSSINNSENLNGHNHDNNNLVISKNRDTYKPNDLKNSNDNDDSNTKQSNPTEQEQLSTQQDTLLDHVNYENYDEFDDGNISSSSLSSSSLSPISDAHSNRTNLNSNISNCSSRDENDENLTNYSFKLETIKDINPNNMKILSKNNVNNDDLGENCTNYNDHADDDNLNNLNKSIVSINENNESLNTPCCNNINNINLNENEDGSGILDSLTPTPTPNTNSQEKFIEFSNELTISNSTNKKILNEMNLIKSSKDESSSYAHPQPTHPPNTLALRTNLNTLDLNGEYINSTNQNETNQIEKKNDESDPTLISSTAQSSNEDNKIITQQSINHQTKITSPQYIAQPAIYAGPGLVSYPTSIANSPMVYHNLPTTVPSNQSGYISYSHPNLNLVQPYPNYHHSHPSSAIQTPTSTNSSLVMSPVGNPQVIASDQSSTSMPTASSSTIYVHVDAGHIFQVHLGDKCKEILGPATVKIVSNDSTQPFPLQLTTPAPGQLVQQILNENGMLTHLIISSQQSNNNQQHSQSQPAQVNNNSQPASLPVTNGSNTNQTPNNSTAIQTYYQVQHLHNANINYAQQTTQQQAFIAQTHYQPQQQGVTVTPASNYHQSYYQNHLNSYNNHGYHYHHHHHSQSQFYNNNNNQYINNNKQTKSSAVPTPSQSPQPQQYPQQQQQQQDQQFDNSQPVKYKKSTSPSSNQSFDSENQSLNLSKTEDNNSDNTNSNSNITNNQITPVQISSQSISPSSLSSCSSTSASVSTSSSISISSNKPINKEEDGQQLIIQNTDFNEITSNCNDLVNLKQKLKPIKLNNPYQYNPSFNNNIINNNRLKENKYFNKKFNSSNLNRTQLVNTVENNINNNKKIYNLNNSFANSTNRINNYNTVIVHPSSQTNRITYNSNISSRSNPAFITTTSINNSNKPNKSKYNNSNHSNFTSQYYSLNANLTSSNEPSQQYQAQYQNFNKSSFNNSNNMDESRVNLNKNNNNNDYNKNKLNDYTSSYGSYKNNNNNSNSHFSNEQGVDSGNENSQDEIIIEINKNLEFYKSLLSKIKEPIVCDIEARSVLIRLSPIELDNHLINKDENESINDESNNKQAKNPSQEENNNTNDTKNDMKTRFDIIIKSFDYLNYTLELASESNSFNKVYTGDANEITLKDLKPNTPYSLRVFASLSSKCRGNYTNVVSFQTLSCQPDQPVPPKLTGIKKKNELTLRWSNPNDNGSKVINFILEYQEVKNYNEDAGSNSSQNEDESNSDDQDIENPENFNSQSDKVFSSFLQIYKGPLKQFTVKKLMPATCYAFRLAAENGYGISEFSKPVLIYTSSSVPNVPEAPKLVESTVATLLLAWGPKRANETDYELQMLDGDEISPSSHGFLTVYNGSLLTYKVNELKRFSPYQFRLRARNEEGNSPWSEVKKYFTKADVPKCPLKLRAKVSQTSIVLVKTNWEIPKDDGGNKILSYYLELAELDDQNFNVVYEGAQLEYTINDKLRPGYNYVMRVSCSNSIGRSPYSELAQFTTPPSNPGKCSAPKLNGKPKSNSAQIKWNYPDQDGGSPITTYEVRLDKTEDEENKHESMNIVYKGNELVCNINGLLPGKNYFVRMRAINKIGSGPWSDPLEFISGAGAPDTPSAPIITAKSANLISISWLEPPNNGSPITEYRLEWSLKENESFCLLYSGQQLKYELKGGILPSTEYVFRLQALNINGTSSYSQNAECLTPSSVPSIVSSIRIEDIQSDCVKISWKQPNSNGSPVLYYNLDFSENSASSNISTQPHQSYIVIHNQELVCEHIIESLQPDAIYKIRIQAANIMGVGQFSSMIKFKTKALPPTPPLLECVSTSYNSIKLKWTPTSSSSSTSSNDFITVSTSQSTSSSKLALNEIIYNLEMILESDIDDNENESESSIFTTVYQGSLTLFKVNKLKESSTYMFRISASNETGQGQWSDLYRFTTTKSPPLISKPPLITDLTQTSCLVEWLPAKLQTSMSKESSISYLSNEGQQSSREQIKADRLEYILQLQVSNSDYKEIYKGDACSFRLVDLEPNTDYNVRVCAVRICNENSSLGSNESNSNSFHQPQRLCSPFSHHTIFTTLKPNKLTISAKNNSAENSTSASNNVETKSVSLLSRLMWPSFYLNINSLQKSNKMSSSNSLSGKNQKPQSITNSKNQTHLLKRRQQQQQQQQQGQRVNEEYTIDNDILKPNRSISDQQWAFILIFFLVVIAFLISYFVISIYQSYYEVEQS